jgi:hypothetical protein
VVVVQQFGPEDAGNYKKLNNYKLFKFIFLIKKSAHLCHHFLFNFEMIFVPLAMIKCRQLNSPKFEQYLNESD